MPRKRIGLTMKKDSGEARDQAAERAQTRGRQSPTKGRSNPSGPAAVGPKGGDPAGGASNAFTDALKGKFGR